jgi:hypothetical protein
MSTSALINELRDLYASGEGVLGTFTLPEKGVLPLRFYVVTSDYKGFLEQIHGVRKVEVHWVPQADYETAIAAAGPEIYVLMEAEIVDDATGEVSALKQDAQERFETYKPSISTLKDLQQRIGVARLELRNAFENAEAAAITSEAAATTSESGATTSADGSNKSVTADGSNESDTTSEVAGSDGSKKGVEHQNLTTTGEIGYICAIYTPLLMQALFAVSGKPAPLPESALVWLNKLQAINTSALQQIYKMFASDAATKAVLFEQYLDQLHGALTQRIRAK